MFCNCRFWTDSPSRPAKCVSASSFTNIIAMFSFPRPDQLPAKGHQVFSQKYVNKIQWAGHYSPPSCCDKSTCWRISSMFLCFRPHQWFTFAGILWRSCWTKWWQRWRRGDLQTRWWRWLWVRLWSWILVNILKARFGQDFNFRFCPDADVWFRFWSQCLIDTLKL